MIYLEELIENPFLAHPQLLDIWPSKSSIIMQEATLETLQYKEIGLYLIKKDNTVIGITGFFTYHEDVTTIGLRWHGLIKEERGNNLSEPIMAQVFKLAKTFYPESKYIMEFVPITNYSNYIVNHFEKIGFEKFGDIENPDWTDNKIQGYRLDMDKYLLKHNNKIKKKI